MWSIKLLDQSKGTWDACNEMIIEVCDLGKQKKEKGIVKFESEDMSRFWKVFGDYFLLFEEEATKRPKLETLRFPTV